MYSLYVSIPQRAISSVSPYDESLEPIVMLQLSAHALPNTVPRMLLALSSDLWFRVC